MRKVLLAALACATLTCWSAAGHQAGDKAVEKDRVVVAAEEKAPVQEAQPASGEKERESETPAPEGADAKGNEPEPAQSSPAVKESEGTGPVAAFWFVLPGR